MATTSITLKARAADNGGERISKRKLAHPMPAPRDLGYSHLDGNPYSKTAAAGSVLHAWWIVDIVLWCYGVYQDESFAV